MSIKEMIDSRDEELRKEALALLRYMLKTGLPVRVILEYEPHI